MQTLIAQEVPRRFMSRRQTNPNPPWNDPDWMGGKDARAIRILTEFLAPQSILFDKGIRDTVVFFGSARTDLGHADSMAAREIAKRLGYMDRSGNTAVERFMKHYYLTAKDIGDLTRIFCAAIEEEHQRKPRLKLSTPWRRQSGLGDFELEGGRLNSKDQGIFEKDPVNFLR